MIKIVLVQMHFFVANYVLLTTRHVRKRERLRLGMFSLCNFESTFELLFRATATRLGNWIYQSLCEIGSNYKAL